MIDILEVFHTKEKDANIEQSFHQIHSLIYNILKNDSKTPLYHRFTSFTLKTSEFEGKIYMEC